LFVQMVKKGEGNASARPILLVGIGQERKSLISRQRLTLKTKQRVFKKVTRSAEWRRIQTSQTSHWIGLGFTHGELENKKKVNKNTPNKNPHGDEIRDRYKSCLRPGRPGPRTSRKDAAAAAECAEGVGEPRTSSTTLFLFCLGSPHLRDMTKKRESLSRISAAGNRGQAAALWRHALEKGW